MNRFTGLVARPALVVAALVSTGCVSIPRDADLVLGKGESRQVTAAIRRDEPGCGPIKHLGKCPAAYINPNIKGRCVLAFLHGNSVMDPDARFFDVYLADGHAELAMLRGGAEDPDMGITSGCAPY